MSNEERVEYVVFEVRTEVVENVSHQKSMRTIEYDRFVYR